MNLKVTCSLINSSALIGGKLISSLTAVISTNERTWILTDHVTFKLPYNLSYQMKTLLAYWMPLSDLGIYNLWWALWNSNNFEFKFDDTRLSSWYKNKIGPNEKLRQPTGQRLCKVRRQQKNFNGANLIFILWGKSGIIKFEFKTIEVSLCDIDILNF